MAVREHSYPSVHRSWEGEDPAPRCPLCCYHGEPRAKSCPWCGDESEGMDDCKVEVDELMLHTCPHGVVGAFD